MRRQLLSTALLASATLAAPVQAAERPPSTTWSIIAMDPRTGDVGAAAASCIEAPLDDVASLWPGRGVSATQASYLESNRDRIQELIGQGRTADAIITAMRTAPASAHQQYGVITLANGNATIAPFTGDSNDTWAGHKTSTEVMPVSTQGNVLEGDAVLARSLAAFNTKDAGPLTMPDRLMRALEAGSAAGGDKRCNTGGVRQTASSAFLMFARGGDAPFTVPESGLGKDAPDPPFLTVSQVERFKGANPLTGLRAQYDTWRKANLADCPDCDLTPIAVPPGRTGGKAGPTPEKSPTDAATDSAEKRADSSTKDDGNSLSPWSIGIPAVMIALGAGLLVWHRRRTAG